MKRARIVDLCNNAEQDGQPGDANLREGLKCCRKWRALTSILIDSTTPSTPSSASFSVQQLAWTMSSVADFQPCPASRYSCYAWPYIGDALAANPFGSSDALNKIQGGQQQVLFGLGPDG
jgi:hypothetical protein